MGTLENGKVDKENSNLVGNTLKFGNSDNLGITINKNTVMIGKFATDDYSYDEILLYFDISSGKLYVSSYDVFKNIYGDATRIKGSYSGTGAKRTISVGSGVGLSQQLILVYGSLGMGFIQPEGSVWIGSGGSVSYEYDTYYNGSNIVMSADSFFNSMNDPYNYTIVYT